MSRHNFCFREYTETQAAPPPSLVELKVRDNQLTQDGEVLFRWRAEEEHSRHSKISEQRACRWDTQSVLGTAHRPSLQDIQEEQTNGAEAVTHFWLGAPRARYTHDLPVK